MRHHLSIDLETYSSEDIKKVGLYRYVDSDDFEILLFAYSVDGGPVEVVDLTSGEQIPHRIISMLVDDDVIKHAFNAAFEWRCLSKYLKARLPVYQWRDTMLHVLYCGYPGSLESAGKALGLSEDDAKMSVGKALIRYFCKPCKPSKVNGGRTRNLPMHEPEKWELFIEYNRQDVIAEMAIENKLSAIPVPDDVQKDWETDLLINSYGVAVDMDLVGGALDIGAQLTDQLMDEARNITGLNNPKSVTQLSEWINSRMPDRQIDNLRKETVAQLLGGSDLPGDVRRVLQIRQELGKTSTTKYDAIAADVCSDGRVRGLLQFYGANRTGRWAGRLVQVQNLPRTYVEPLDEARSAVKCRDAETLRDRFGPPNDILSQLIRTAFVSTRNSRDPHVLIDADFSAIEARVISWLAGETWKIDVFRTHGKIYEATASQMFNIPFEKIKKGNPEYKYRQYGKIAELALGYQGGVGAMRAMDATGSLNDLTDDEVGEMVKMWRNKNSRIADLWWSINEKAIKVIGEGGSEKIYLRFCVGDQLYFIRDPQGGPVCITLRRESDLKTRHSYLTIELPSKRKLYYINPKLGENKWGGSSILYTGVDQTNKKWTTLETYGGKLVENIVQAIARDCLANAIKNLANAGFLIVFHIHDEVVIDSPRFASDEKMLDKVVELMTIKPSWAVGLPLGADGWVGEYFKKD